MPTSAVQARVNAHDYNSLFASLNHALELLHQHRTPDPSYIAAYDTLKQSRAMLANAIRPVDGAGAMEEPRDLVAA
jgi:hypothetical protein